ncbi:MAG TPA: SCO family protein [Thermoanaerobaculia bacterium]|nr:SCO family protein [Thermoanaerobaculia bacterium]
MTGRARVSIPALLVAIFAAAACRQGGGPAPGPSANAKRYPIEGVIRGVDAGRITLDHGPVAGLMEGMTMTIPVHADPGALARLRVGDRIAATLVMDGDLNWLESVRPAPPPTSPAASSSAASSGSPTPRPNQGVPLGDAIPDFTLTDQTGRPVRLSQFAGEPVAVTFLYTRCPVATACPMTTAKFSRLDAMIKEKGFGQLLTITVDPEHDTPAVLAEYAKGAGADSKRWKFLTGDPRAVADVAERFGVLYYPDHGQVVHSQAVAVLDAHGKLASIYYGEDWQPEHIFRDMEKARKG